MENKQPIVSVKSVYKSYGKTDVLQDINLEIYKGEIFGLLGPSGAGKTTIVKQLVCLDTPTRGENLLFNEKMPSLSLVEKIGFMSQSDALYEELTAKENLEFFSSLYHLNKKQTQQRIAEVMEMVQLSEHLDKLVSDYSGGMKRRLSLAIALLHKPELLILDEPTVGIDPLLRKKIWNSFFGFRNSGTTIMVTTHVMDEAEKCDRLGLIQNGRLIAAGTPAELKEMTNSSTIEEVFLSLGGVTNAN